MLHDRDMKLVHRANQVRSDGKPARTRSYIILLNWNGWQDTIECLESLLRMDRDDFTVILVDNGSADGSYEHLRQWAATAGTHAGELIDGGAGSDEVERCFAVEWAPHQGAAELQPEAKVVLIQTGSNLGFAGGCNVGLRYGLARDDAEYFWLLNNDTVVDPAALHWQVKKMEERSDLGIVGSTLISYDAPNQLQCCAGHDFNTWTARVRPVSNATAIDALPPETEIEARLRYVSGASMFVKRAFLKEVGLLNEQYFLYFEEIDWTTRAKGRYALGYCAQSHILHKEGRSIGSNHERQKRSLFSEHYLSRNRVLFTRTHFPLRVPVVLLWVSCVALSRLIRGDVRRAWVIFVGAWFGLLAKRCILTR